MKKLFTLFACVLLAGISTLRAENITLYVYDGDDVDWQSIKSTITKDAEGVYSVTNFLYHTNVTLSFKFDENVAVGSKTPVTLAGHIQEDSDYPGYYDILTTGDKYPRCNFVKEVGDTTVVRYPYIYNPANSTTYCYVQGLDKEEYGYDYVAEFYVSGFGSDGKSDAGDFYFYFYFNRLPDPEKPVSLGEVDVEIYDENSKEVAKGYKSELTVTSEGVYTLANFIDSGASLSFTFDSSIEVDDYTKIVPTGNVSVEGSYYDILTASGGSPIGKLKALEGDGVTNVYYPYVYADAKAEYSYVMKLDKAEYGYEYYACINFSGYDADVEYLDDYYLEFYFNGKTTGVSTVVVVDDENAPVEYYNLNGQRVNNPSNGLFIRKQGSKVQKVIIR